MDIQSASTLALRQGLINYDRRKGWRGSLVNKKYAQNWNTGLESFRLEKSINWKLAIVKKSNDLRIEIETEDKENGLIRKKDILWIKKSNNNIISGDVVYVKKLKKIYLS